MEATSNVAAKNAIRQPIWSTIRSSLGDAKPAAPTLAQDGFQVSPEAMQARRGRPAVGQRPGSCHAEEGVSQKPRWPGREGRFPRKPGAGFEGRGEMPGFKGHGEMPGFEGRKPMPKLDGARPMPNVEGRKPDFEGRGQAPGFEDARPMPDFEGRRPMPRFGGRDQLPAGFPQDMPMGRPPMPMGEPMGEDDGMPLDEGFGPLPEAPWGDEGGPEMIDEGFGTPEAPFEIEA